MKANIIKRSTPDPSPIMDDFPKTFRQPCGHPEDCIVSGEDGTNYCGWCADIEKWRRAANLQIDWAQLVQSRLIRFRLTHVDYLCEICGAHATEKKDILHGSNCPLAALLCADETAAQAIKKVKAFAESTCPDHIIP